jgi:hypothetical protein
MALGHQITGNAGLYYCCYQLSLRGWNVMPTARNARGIDIVAYRPDLSKYRGIQVKSLSKRFSVPLGPSLDRVGGDYWVVVNNIAAALSDGPDAAIVTHPTAYIMTPAEVSRDAVCSGNVNKSYWLEPKDYTKVEFMEAWSRIGLG